MSTHSDDVQNELDTLHQRIAQLEAERVAAQAQADDELTQINQSPEAIAIHHNGRLAHVNPAAVKLIGALEPSALVNRSIFDFVHPDSRDLVLKRVRHTNKRGTPTQLAEERFVRLDGSIVDVETLAHPTTFAGRPATQVFIRDITARKRTEARLRFLAKASSTLADSLDLETTLTLLAHLAVPDLADCCVVDLSDEGIRRNAAIATVDPAQEVLLREIQRRYPPVSQTYQPAIDGLRTGAAMMISEMTNSILAAIATDDRHLVLLRELAPTSSIGAPLIARGQLLGMITLLTTNSRRRYDHEDLQLAEDLAHRAAVAADNARLYRETQLAMFAEQAARRRAEQAERRQAFLAQAGTLLAETTDYDERLNHLAHLLVPEFAHYCLVDVVEDRQQLRRVANSHADSTHVRLLDELALYSPPEWNAPDAASKALRSSEVQVVPELSLHDARDAQHMRLLVELGTHTVLAVPMTARERIIGVITLARGAHAPPFDADDCALALELANRAAVAIDNARLYRESLEAVKVRDRFISIASHELKTPLTTLLGNAQLLERRTRSNPAFEARERRAINLIIDQTRRLSRMVIALLDLSRSDSDQIQIEHTPVDVVKLARRIIGEVQMISDRHTIQLIALDVQLIVEGDELRLEQVLQNLIQNAIKYSPHGGTVDVCVEPRGDVVRISVSDQGIGIPASELPQLFGRFYRATNAEPQRIQGMGIGLYVVKQIVVLHGGDVEVQSVEGQGSTFTVTLPRSHPDAA